MVIRLRLPWSLMHSRRALALDSHGWAATGIQPPDVTPGMPATGLGHRMPTLIGWRPATMGIATIRAAGAANSA